MDLHIYLHTDQGGLDQKLDQVLTILQGVINMDAQTRAALDNLNLEVAREATVDASVITLLNGLSAQIAALKAGQTDPAVIAAIDAATAIVKADTDKRAAAVVATTPV